MIDLEDLRDYVVQPTLLMLEMYSKAAERLVIGTALAESVIGNDMHLRQIEGPALSPWMIEPKTAKDNWKNYILFRSELGKRMANICIDYQDDAELMWNLRLACAHCRIWYYRNPSPLPHEDDITGMASYWKNVYNTSEGAGTEEQFIRRAQVVLEL